MAQKKTSLSKNFAFRLKSLREKKNWSQEQIASKVGVDGQRISKYERGISFPAIDTIIKLAAILEVSIDYLLLDTLKEDVEARAKHVKNHILLEQFRKFEKLPREEQCALELIFDALFKKYNLVKE